MRFLRLLATLLATAWASSAPADLTRRPEVAAFIQDLAARQHFDAASLSKLFAKLDISPKIIAAMDHPAEAKPWWQYQRLVLSEEHIQGGVEFWRQYRAALEEAQSRYGVEPALIVAIIGAESGYGQTLGTHPVLEALSTLAFGYPRRADYFRKELEEYLLLCREEGIDPAWPRGSYAGAMGMPQFMPSSYRAYAADLDGDRKRNIWTNPPDAIASIANYFAHVGWHQGEPVAVPAKTTGDGFRKLPAEAEYPVAEWRGLGVEPAAPLPDTARARLLVLEGEKAPEYWLALPNFLAITRYNHSPLYALAAFQLGQAITARKGGTPQESKP